MTGNPIARLATERDVARIVEICSAGWRDTYAALKTPGYIERTIAEFYTTERVASDIGASDLTWGGYVVAELDGCVLVAGGGGLIEPGVGELFVLYADPRQRRRGGGTAVLDYITEQQRKLGANEQWVSVAPANELGLAFYEAQGFLEAGRRPAYRGDGESLRLYRAI